MEWRVEPKTVTYPDALAWMERRVAGIIDRSQDDVAWLVEHPPLLTAGSSAKIEDLRDPARFPVFETRRGGQYTYHGPGQRVVYIMVDLSRREKDVRRFVATLEHWVIATLAEFGLTGHIRDGRVGVWVERPDKPPLPDGTPRDDKIAAIGLRVRKWVTFHGLSINVEPDLGHYDAITPCGIIGHGVTSLVDLGLPITMDDLDLALRRTSPF